MSYGRLVTKALASAGAGGNEYAELAPAAGEEWDVLECVGYHDNSAGALDTFWGVSDATTVFYRSTVSIAQLLRQDFMSTVTGTSVIGNSVKGSGCITLHHTQYIRFNVNTLVAGKKAYINAIIRVRKGCVEWV